MRVVRIGLLVVLLTGCGEQAAPPPSPRAPVAPARPAVAQPPGPPPALRPALALDALVGPLAAETSAAQQPALRALLRRLDARVRGLEAQLDTPTRTRLRGLTRQRELFEAGWRLTSGARAACGRAPLSPVVFAPLEAALVETLARLHATAPPSAARRDLELLLLTRAGVGRSIGDHVAAALARAAEPDAVRLLAPLGRLACGALIARLAPAIAGDRTARAELLGPTPSPTSAALWRFRHGDPLAWLARPLRLPEVKYANPSAHAAQAAAGRLDPDRHRAQFAAEPACGFAWMHAVLALTRAPAARLATVRRAARSEPDNAWFALVAASELLALGRPDDALAELRAAADRPLRLHVDAIARSRARLSGGGALVPARAALGGDLRHAAAPLRALARRGRRQVAALCARGTPAALQQASTWVDLLAAMALRYDAAAPLDGGGRRAASIDLALARAMHVLARARGDRALARRAAWQRAGAIVRRRALAGADTGPALALALAELQQPAAAFEAGWGALLRRTASRDAVYRERLASAARRAARRQPAAQALLALSRAEACERVLQAFDATPIDRWPTWTLHLLARHADHPAPLRRTADPTVARIRTLGHRGEPSLPALRALLAAPPDAAPARVALSRALGRCGAAAAPTLGKALSQPRQALIAERALGRLGRSALPELTRALEQEASRAAAARLLRPLAAQAAPAAAALTRALDDPRDDVHAEVVQTLTAIGPAAAPAVEPLLRDLAVEDRRVAAARALGAIGPDAAPAIEPLIRMLRLAEPAPSDAAAGALAGIGASAVPRLAEQITLGSGGPVQRRAATALARIGPAARAALPALRDELRYSRRVPVQLAVLGALAAIGRPLQRRTLDAVEAMLRRAEPAQRRRIVRLLARLAADRPDLRAALGEVLIAGAEDPVQAAVALIDSGADPPAGRRQLLALIGGEIPERSAEAYRAVLANGAPAVPQLVERLQTWPPRLADVDLLLRIGEPSAAPLGRLLAHADPRVRMVAAEVLAALGRKARPASDALQRALADPDPRVTRWATRALARIGLPLGPEALLGALDRTPGLDGLTAALATVGPPIVPALLARLERPATRAAALDALRRLGPEAVEPLLAAWPGSPAARRPHLLAALRATGDAGLARLIGQLDVVAQRDGAVALLDALGASVTPALLAALAAEPPGAPSGRVGALIELLGRRPACGAELGRWLTDGPWHRRWYAIAVLGRQPPTGRGVTALAWSTTSTSPLLATHARGLLRRQRARTGPGALRDLIDRALRAD